MKKHLPNKMIFVTVILMDLLTGMEFDLFVPSFPELRNQFHLSPFWVETLLSVNLIGYCLSLFFVGDLADRYGRKPIILLGQIIFIIGSILCLWPGIWYFLLIGRCLQGIGIAAPAILSFLIIADAYPLKEQQFLMAIMNGAINAAAGIAPVIGSYLSLYFHWQGNFAALLAFGLVTFIMTIIYIPRYKLNMTPKEKSVAQGYLAIFQTKPLILLTINILFIFIPYWIFVGMSPLLYIEDLGVTLSHFGYYQGILAIIFAIGSVLFGLVIRSIDFDRKKMLYFANTILIASFAILAFMTFIDSKNPLYITLAFLPFIIGQIIPSTILYPLSLNYLPHAKGRVSAIIQSARLILTAISLQIAGYFYQGSFLSIGIILLIFIIIAIITLFMVINNRDLMQFQQHVIMHE